jgi:glucose-1-phosphate thymidylyltransferase
MKVVIPLAGYGTRLRPHTYTRPKPLINIAGKPVLGHLLDKLGTLDVSEYIFIVGYLGDQIEEYITKNHNVPAKYVVQHEMLGQSHAIYLAREHLTTDEPVFVVFGDHIFETGFDLIKEGNRDAVIYVKEVDDPRRYGVVMLDDQRHIVKIVEKPANPPTNLAVIGLYYINSGRKLIEAIERQIKEEKKTKNEYYIADALQNLIEEGLKLDVETVSNWLDCGNPESVLEANRYLLSEGGKDNSNEVNFDNVIIIPPVRIDPSCVIKHSVIGPYVTISGRCKIEWSIVRDSIVGEEAEIQNMVLETSLVGQNAFVKGQFTSFNVGDSSSVRFS